MAWVGFPPNPAQAGVSFLDFFFWAVLKSYRCSLLAKHGNSGN